MNAAPISVNPGPGGNAGGAIGQAVKASTLPAFAQVMSQKQTEASTPKHTAAAPSGAENANGANGSTEVAAQKSSDNGPVNAGSHASGNGETAKKSDAKGKSSNGPSVGKSAAQMLAQPPAQSVGQVPAIPGGLNGAAPWVAPGVAKNAAVIPAETQMNNAVSAETAGATLSNVPGGMAGTKNAAPAEGTGTQQQEPASAYLANPIVADLMSLPVNEPSAPAIPAAVTAENSAASPPATKAESGASATPTPATAKGSSEGQTNLQMPVPAVPAAGELSSSRNEANPVGSEAAQCLPGAGNDPVPQNAGPSSGSTSMSVTAPVTSEKKPGDLDATAAAMSPAVTPESAATNTQTAPKNQRKGSVQEIPRGAAALVGKESQAVASASVSVSVNAAKDVVGTVKGKSGGNGSGTQTAPAPVVGAKNDSAVSAKGEPVTPEVAEAPEKRGTAKPGNNTKGNSSADAMERGNGSSAGSVGEGKDSGVGTDPNAVHGAITAAQNDPGNLAANVANAVPAPVSMAGKDSTNAMAVKAGDSSSNGAPAAPDADDAAPPPNESRVVNVAQLAGDQGHSQVRIAMQADQLGQVELRATLHGQQVGAAITVEKKEAHAAMAAEMPSLQQALEERQLRVGEVTLMQGALHSTAGDAGNAAAEQQRRGQAGTSYQQVENETMVEVGMMTIFDSSGIFDESGRLSVRA